MLKKHVFSVVLAASCAVSHAQSRPFGDWSVLPAADKSGDVIAATTIENGDAILAVRCFIKDQTCVHALQTSSTCQDQSTYPILLNGTSGATSIEGTCLDGNQLILSPFDPVRKNIVESTGIVGFAFPMASGAFRVFRFSTKGSSAAIGEAERLVREGNRRRNLNRPGAVTL